MSVQTTFCSPSCSASCFEPTTPPIGPEISDRASSRASIEIVPPCAAMIRRSNAAPASRVTARTFFNCSRDGSAAYASTKVELSRGKSRRERVQLG